MKSIKKDEFHQLKDFLILWSTQSISQLGSSITAFALTLWLYEETGSSLSTATLTICSYTPYVLMSIFAGALTDRFDKKKTMLICDVFAACCTVLTWGLFRTGYLTVWHLYALNAVSGLMNTVQQPASEVAMTLVIPEQYYQKTSGLRSLSGSMLSVLNPLIATALYSFAGLEGVIAADIGSFLVAFAALLFFIQIPESRQERKEGVLVLAKEGIGFLKNNPMILTLILFMAGVNLVASAFDATLPGYVLPNPKGGQAVLGMVTSCSGIAMIIGSLIVSVLPKPKDRVKVVYWTMLFSLGTENFLLAFSREPIVWCIGQIIGWVLVPIMSANLDVILRSSIPVDLQGRVYACRNTLQFFTIPIGLFLGGFMVDQVCEPFMKAYDLPILNMLFGTGKGSGAALMMLVLGVGGIFICMMTGKKLKPYTVCISPKAAKKPLMQLPASTLAVKNSKKEGKHMNYRELGTTGLSVSEIGMGCEGFSENGYAMTKELFDAAEKHGINYFDLYASDPRVREAVGSAMLGRREKFIVQSHICSVWQDGQYKRSRDLGEVRAGFEEMMRLLQTDYIDVGMIHYCDSMSDWETIRQNGILDFAAELKKQGRIRHIGLSSHNPQVALAAVRTGLIEVLMFSANPCYDLQPADEDVNELWNEEKYKQPLVNMNPQRQELYETCQALGVGITVMKAFGGGDLLNEQLSPAKKALSVTQCLHYALTRPAVATVLAGAHTLEQLEQCILYETASGEEKDYAKTFASFPNISWEGYCMYCSHCAPCPQKIDVASVTKFYNLTLAQNTVPETVREHYAALAHHAGECIECGACETRCPFHVPIRENMKRAAKVFGK